MGYEMRGIRKVYRGEPILHELDWSIAQGSITALIGHNGSGKSTLLKILAGVLRADGGSLVCPKLRPRVGYLPENCQWYGSMTGESFLRHMARLVGDDPAAIPGKMKEAGLWDHRDKRIRSYSKGMKQKVGFIQARLGNPELLVLDEPTSGFDPWYIDQFYGDIKALSKQGVTVVLSTHTLTEVDDHITHAAYLQGGQLRWQGDWQQLIEISDLPAEVGFPLADRTVWNRLWSGFAELALEGNHDGERCRIRITRRNIRPLLAILLAEGIPLDRLDVRQPDLDDYFRSQGAAQGKPAPNQRQAIITVSKQTGGKP